MARAAPIEHRLTTTYPHSELALLGSLTADSSHEDALAESLREGQSLILLRYVMIAAAAYLFLFEGETASRSVLATVIAMALLSNVLLSHAPHDVLTRPLAVGAVVCADIAWIAFGLLFTGKFGSDIFFLYFFVLFLAAMGQNLLLIVGAGTLIGLMDLAFLVSPGHGQSAWTSAQLIRIPFIFTASLFYGHLTERWRHEQKKRVSLGAIFSKYLSSDVVDELLKDREGLGLVAKRRHITVLFSDIRGFTSISEQIAPEQVVSLLSDYLGQVTHIVFKHGGAIDKFIGDGVFAIFGAPKSYADAALRAVKTGMEMIELAESLGSKWAQVIGQPLKVGVGINSGEAVVGSIGSEMRSDFTAIGDTVNVGARLEALTKELGVPMLISEFTAAELKDSIHLRPLQQVKLEGREAPILVYCPESLLQESEFALDAVTSYVHQKK